MAGRSRFTPEQLAKIKSTLKNNLGEDSDKVVGSFDKRFAGGGGGEVDDAPGADGKPKRPEFGKVDVPGIINEGNIPKMIQAIADIGGEPNGTKALVQSIMAHKDAKGYHLVEALAKVKQDKELVAMLVDAIVANGALNPIIEALRSATVCNESMKKLAQTVAELGSVNQIIRAIATAPSNEDTEAIWAMEIIGKGTSEQMLEALSLINKESSGVVILATGLASLPDNNVPTMVRALPACKENPQAAAIIAKEVAKLADVNSMVGILEKFVPQESEAGELLIAKLVDKGRINQMLEAARQVRVDSPASKLLAMGIISRAGGMTELERGYKLLGQTTIAKNMIANEILKKKGKLMAMKFLGKEVFEIGKKSSDLDAFTRKAKKRVQYILENELND